jgi:salicylate hydroxylase
MSGLTLQVNHMAQGAATSMEDGAFLARCIHSVIEEEISLPKAIEIYETARMPKAHFKQQVSFINGALWHLESGPTRDARDKAMSSELDGSRGNSRSPNLYGDPEMMAEVYGYDAEKHADEVVGQYVEGRGLSGDMAQRDTWDPRTGVTRAMWERYMGWFLPEERIEANL